MVHEYGKPHSKKTRKKLSKAMKKVVKTKKYKDSIFQLKAKVARNRKIFG